MKIIEEIYAELEWVFVIKLDNDRLVKFIYNPIEDSASKDVLGDKGYSLIESEKMDELVIPIILKRIRNKNLTK